MLFKGLRKVREVLWPITAVAVVLLAAFSGLFLLELAGSVDGAILYVGKTSTYSSISDALSAAKAGDTIIIGPGQYNESISIDKDKVTIFGNGSAQTTVRGQGILPTMEIRSDDVTISGLRIEDGAIISSSSNLTLANLTIDCSTDPAVDLTNTENCTITDTTFLSTLGKAISSTGTKYTRLNRVSSVAGTLLYSTNSLYTYVTDCVFGREDMGLVISSSKQVRVDLLDSMTIGGSPAVSFQTSSHIFFGSGALVQEFVGQCPITFNGCNNISIIDLALPTSGEGVTFTDCGRVYVENLFFWAAGWSTFWAIGLTDTDDVLIENSTFISNEFASTHIRVRGTVNDVSVKNCSFTLRGSDSTAVNIGQNSKVEVLNSTFSIESERSIGITLGGTGCTLRGNTYYVSDGLSIGANITGPNNALHGEVMFVSGTSSIGIFSEEEGSDLYVYGARIRVTGTSAVGMALKNYGTSQINATIVNVTEAGGPCLSATGSYLSVNNSTFNTRSNSPSVLLNTGNAIISDTWFHGKTQGLGLQDCDVVNIARSTMNGLTPCWARGSENVLLVDCDLFDLFYPVPGVRAMDGSKVFLRDAHFEDLDCDGTSEMTVSNSISTRTLTRHLTPLPDVDIEAISDPNVVYQTAHFTQFGGYPRTDQNGLVGPFEMVYAKYVRSNHPVHPANTIEVFEEGTAAFWSATYTINASEKRTIDLISPDIDLPMVPQNLTAVPLTTREALFLNWERNSDDTAEYWVHMLDELTGNMVLMAKVDGSRASYTTEDLGERLDVTFEVRAYDGTYLSAPSNRINATTVDLTPPPSPSELTADKVTDSWVQLSWEHAGSDDLSTFEVLINDTGTSALFHVVGTAEPQERTFTVNGLTWNTWYHLQLRAIDLSGNGSPLAEDLLVRTMYPPLKVVLQVRFEDDGPNAGEPANGSELTLFTSSGLKVGTYRTDGSGTSTITDLVPEQSYYVEAYPPEGTEGEEGTRAGYLKATSIEFSLTAGSQPLGLELVLPYQPPVVVGLIKVRVEFGGGNRVGPVYQAIISLIGTNGNVLRTVLASGEGTATFSVTELPFSGIVRAKPPEDLEGDPSENVDGYLEATSGTLNLTRDDPFPGEVLLSLPYYEGSSPPRYLYILRKMPTGSSVNLDTPLSITFDQPVDTSTVETSLNIEPPLSSPIVSWSSDQRTITISHEGLEPKTSYKVSVGSGAASMNGTSFPPGYSESTWTFRTTGEPGDGPDEGPNLFVMLLIAIAVTALLVGVVIWVITMRNRDEGDDDHEPMDIATIGPEAPSGQEYPSDLVNDMITGMPRGSASLEE